MTNYTHKDNVYHSATLCGDVFTRVMTTPLYPKKERELSLLTDTQKTLNCGRFESSLIRSKSMVKRYIMTNFKSGDSQFSTLTYANRITKSDYSRALHDFDNFMDRIRRLYPDIKYIAIVELQRDIDYKGDPNGRIHFHIVTDGLRFTDESIISLWKNGKAWTKITFGESSKMACYLTKYLTKQLFLPIRKHTFLKSKNLEKWLQLSGYSQVELFYQSVKNQLSTPNEYIFYTNYGMIKVQHFLLL